MSSSNKCSDAIKQWLSSFSSENSNPTTTSWKIQRVPPIIRAANVDCYNPLVVSIGPYHHGKSELELMEKHKCKIASKYANNDKQMLENLYTKVMDVAKDARDCYKDDKCRTVSKFEDEKFTQMMFLDGCFVLQVIYCFAKDKHDELGMKRDIIAYVKQDLFLLENQIPFLVLKELMCLRPQFRDWNKLFNDFIKNEVEPTSEDPKRTTGKNERAHQQDQLNLQVKDEPPAHLLEYTREQLIGKLTFTTGQNNGQWSSYRSAKELKTVGINFKPSKTHQFGDVSFTNNIFTDQLNLPPITIDDSTKPMLLNMIAYEACPDISSDFGVTSYICFLDSLIDHAEDVEELRSSGILQNFLGSDQQVADLFNQIADKLVPNPNAYTDVKGKIEKHYNSKMKHWLAEFWHSHFTSPWTLLAFLGALFALVLSGIQTYKAMYPPSENNAPGK